MTQEPGTEARCEAALPILVDGARQLGVRLDPSQQRQFTIYCRLLEEGNQRFNLTGIREPENVMRSLFLDSLTVAAALPASLRERGELRVVDVGSGAGLPGLPVSIVHPNWSVTLVEATGKKARFLRQSITALGLPRVNVVGERVEAIGTNKRWRDAADLVVARAVASLEILLEYCAPLARPRGWLAFPKSGDIAAEVARASRAAKALNVEFDVQVPVPATLGLGSGRATVLYRKTGATPPGYPRRVGLARTRPIGGTQEPAG